MSDQPIISVALCTHNGASFIGEQLASILKQDRMPNELIVSDDASTDDTVAIVRSLAADFEAASVALMVLENSVALGVTKNFEQALASTTGDLLFLSDQDDVWHRDRVSTCVEIFEKRSDVDLLFTDALLVDGSGHKLDMSLFDTLEVTGDDRQSIHRGEGFPLLLRRNLATGATMAFRRSVFEAALPFPGVWVHDEWLAIIGAALGTVDMVEEATIDYRQHGANQIGVQRPTLSRKMRKVMERRGDRVLNLATRSYTLAVRLNELGSAVRSDYQSEARGKTTMENFRLAMPHARLRRIVPILRADREGWYAKYSSQGRRDMLRDLLQSHD